MGTMIDPQIAPISQIGTMIDPQMSLINADDSDRRITQGVGNPV
jgi:hypothetical protein